MNGKSGRWRIGVALALALVSISPSAADFHAGLEAFERGDEPRALREWLPLAQADHVEAQYWLGRLYSGSSETAAPAEALRWYTRAAGLGHAASRNNLGRIYELGRGVTANAATAFGWYRAAAEAGLPVAQANLARLYELGIGVAPDAAEALRWYRAAAESGHAGARYSLGLMYLEGRGVRADRDAGLRWIKRAAKLGHEQARLALEHPAKDPDAAGGPADRAIEHETSGDDPSSLYARARDIAVGHGVMRDDGSAGRIFELAARRGHGPSAYRLALLLRSGNLPGGVDLVRAFAWMSVASNRGIEDAPAWLERMARRMNDAEREQARRLADQLGSD